MSLLFQIKLFEFLLILTLSESLQKTTCINRDVSSTTNANKMHPGVFKWNEKDRKSCWMCIISMTVVYAVLGQFVYSQHQDDIQIDSVYTNSKIERILDKHGV